MTPIFALALLLSPPTYRMAHEVKLGGEGGWDYLYADSQDHRLYISRGTHVQVVDTRNNRVMGDISDTPGVHGVAIAHNHNVGFTSNGRDNTVTEFDLRSLKAIKKISVGNRPDAIFYDPYSDRVFTFNAGSEDATAIDAGTASVAGSVPLGGKPEFPATDGTGNMFVNIEDKSTIAEFDPKGLAVKATWPLAPGEEASGLAIDTADHVLFATCSNEKMAVVDYTTGQVVATPAIGKGPDAAGFDPQFGLAFASCGIGSISVIGKDASGNWANVATIPTQRGARTMTLDERTHKIYLVTADFQAPPAGATGQRRRGTMVPGSFRLLVVQPTRR